jgi:CheY-specific phosphatase CheX
MNSKQRRKQVKEIVSMMAEALKECDMDAEFKSAVSEIARLTAENTRLQKLLDRRTLNV